MERRVAMKTPSGTQLAGAGLALAMTLATVGYMAFKQNELADAAKQGRENRLNNLDLAPRK
jgi:hypothetical protein